MPTPEQYYVDEYFLEHFIGKYKQDIKAYSHLFSKEFSDLTWFAHNPRVLCSVSWLQDPMTLEDVFNSAYFLREMVLMWRGLSEKVTRARDQASQFLEQDNHHFHKVTKARYFINQSNALKFNYNFLFFPSVCIMPGVIAGSVCAAFPGMAQPVMIALVAVLLVIWALLSWVFFATDCQRNNNPEALGCLLTCLKASLKAIQALPASGENHTTKDVCIASKNHGDESTGLVGELEDEIAYVKNRILKLKCAGKRGFFAFFNGDAKHVEMQSLVDCVSTLA